MKKSIIELGSSQIALVKGGNAEVITSKELECILTTYSGTRNSYPITPLLLSWNLIEIVIITSVLSLAWARRNKVIGLEKPKNT